MAPPRVRSLVRPDDTNVLPLYMEEIVDLGDLSVARNTAQPGWRWSTHIRPHVGGDWCQVRHVGIVLSGRMGCDFEDGTSLECGPLDAFDIPPGHDGYALGDEPLVTIEWAGARAFVGFRAGAHRRVLATLLFTDIVGSTDELRRRGDTAWRELLSTHFESARGAIHRHGGREVQTTGDGLLARFEAPAHALRCAAELRALAHDQGIRLRAGVHVGEVELVGDGLRGVTVHEAARVMAAADADDILVSETTRALARAAALAFEDRGARELKGLEGEWRLYAFVE